MAKTLGHILGFAGAVLFIVLCSTGCDKNSMFSDHYFSLQINSVVGEYEPQSVKVKNGITVIAAAKENKQRSETVIITVNGDKEGEYRQVYDYKTGVSVKSCGLTYKITAKKSDDDKPAYYTSYEGEIVISEINRAEQLISGKYNFYTRALDSDTVIHQIKGEFMNIPFE